MLQRPDCNPRIHHYPQSGETGKIYCWLIPSNLSLACVGRSQNTKLCLSCLLGRNEEWKKWSLFHFHLLLSHSQCCGGAKEKAECGHFWNHSWPTLQENRFQRCVASVCFLDLRLQTSDLRPQTSDFLFGLFYLLLVVLIFYWFCSEPSY